MKQKWGERRAFTTVLLHQQLESFQHRNKFQFREKKKKKKKITNGSCFYFFLGIMILSQNLFVISQKTKHMYMLHTTVLTMDSSSTAFTASGLFSLMMSKCRGADGSKTLLEEMKHMQLVAVCLFI